MIDAAFHHDLHQLDVAGVNLGFLLEGDVFGLLVCAFTKPDANAFGEQFFDVGLGAPHIGLDYGAYAVLVSRNAVQLVNEVERPLRVGRTFHVDANEILWRHAGGFGDQAADDLVSHALVHIQAHVGQFQADVGIQLVGGNFVEQVMVELSAGAGFVGVGDILAEIVDGDAGADLIYDGGYTNRVRDLGAGDEAGGIALAETGAFSYAAQPAALGEGDEDSSQHGGPGTVRLVMTGSIFGGSGLP